jgi:hypothetical protein
MAVASVVAVVCTWAGVAELRGKASPWAGLWLAKAADGVAAWPASWGGRPQIVGAAIADSTGGSYRNPLRGVKGLVEERIDDGVDFAGAGPVYALGDGVVTSADGANYGWPGGGWITYRLSSGPGVGLMVYVAEDIIPAIVAGQRVSASTVLGTMYDGGDGIETGWAQLTGLSAESELPEAGGIGGLGPSPPGSGSTSTNCSSRWECPPRPTAPSPRTGFSRPVTQPAGDSPPAEDGRGCHDGLVFRAPQVNFNVEDIEAADDRDTVHDRGWRQLCRWSMR